MNAARRIIGFACVAGLFLAGSANATDWLSGAYRPVQAADSKHGADAPLPLLVARQGNGWLARFDGQDRRLEPVPVDELAELLPGINADADLQCAASASMMLCHVKPGTVLEGEGFTSSSGYFSVIVDAGVFELEKYAD
ncbi:MAG: hypothetical protein ACOH1R_00615 [Luteimonas sp.]